MGARVPVQHYNLNSPTSFIESPLHVLNAVDARTAPSPIDHIAATTADVHRDPVADAALDNATHDAAAVVSGPHYTVSISPHCIQKTSIFFFILLVGLYERVP